MNHPLSSLNWKMQWYNSDYIIIILPPKAVGCVVGNGIEVRVCAGGSVQAVVFVNHPDGHTFICCHVEGVNMGLFAASICVVWKFFQVEMRRFEQQSVSIVIVMACM